MLARCRRRAGIFMRGRGPHVNLPSAWLELSVLSQCSGPTGIEALQILCTSAEQTELKPTVASPLLALAKWAVAHLLADGARLQGLPVFAANTALSHLTLLRLCECVCLRLYCLKLTGAIPENNAFEEYMHGLVELEDAYSLVPCARLSVNIIVAASVAESKFLPESASGQFLRRSLMLWLCVRDRNRHSDHHHQQQQQQLLLGHALNSAQFIREDEWTQGAVGLLVLGDAAANGATFILRELQQSFAGVPPYPGGLGESGAAATATAAFLWLWPWQMSCIFPSVLSDVALHGRTAELRKRALVGEAGSADEALAPCGPGSGPKGGGLLQLTQLNHDDGAGPPVSLSAAVRCSSARALRRLCRGLQRASGEDGASPRGLPSRRRPRDPFLGSALGGASAAEERERDAAVQVAWRLAQEEFSYSEGPLAGTTGSYLANLLCGTQSNHHHPPPPPKDEDQDKTTPTTRASRRNLRQPPEPSAGKLPRISIPAGRKSGPSLLERADLDLRQIVDGQFVGCE
ncbi:transmembrane protein 232 isoform X2 [Petromyzon marinus]|nr:transmembrane protein 232 isoform X2 [Petromyzon marinus]